MDGERVTAEERGVAPWFAIDDKDENKSSNEWRMTNTIRYQI